MHTDDTTSTILIVDDDPTNLGVLVDTLNSEAINVSVATSGENALDMVKDVEPDLILLDVMMPEMDGFETCRRFKNNAATQDIPVIFLTALIEVADKIRGFETGGIDYITKPFQQEEVLSRVAAHLTIQRQQKQLRTLNACLEAERTSLTERVRERTVELQRLNAELVRAMRLKNDFLGNMSHEFRTPLNVILGMTEVLQGGTYGPQNERQLSSLHHIRENGQRLLELLTNLLDLSEIGMGELELQMTLVPVETLCQAGLRFLNQAARRKHLRISFTLDSAVTTIHADEGRLKQVLIELISNAVKFTTEGGTVGLDVEGDAENRLAHFTVWDTGIGIASDDMEHLFQPFVHVNDSYARGYEGAGIGLSLLDHIVHLHGGHVTVESEVDKGSRFRVSLPWNGDARP